MNVSTRLNAPHTDATGAALLANITDNPADDTIRLVYADWLEEQGDHQRAAFLRAHVNAHDTDATEAAWVMFRYGWLGGEPFRDRLYRREPGSNTATDATHDSPDAYSPQGFGFTLDRGLLAAMSCDSNTWLDHGDRIRAHNPLLARVTIGYVWDALLTFTLYDHGRPDPATAYVTVHLSRFPHRPPVTLTYPEWLSLQEYGAWHDVYAEALANAFPGVSFDLPTLRDRARLADRFGNDPAHARHAAELPGA